MGPRIDPCGTPEVTGKGLDVAPNEVTRRYDSSHVRKSPPPPPKKKYSCSFLKSFAWFTLSKDLDLSR